MSHHLPNTTASDLAYPQYQEAAWPPDVEVPVAASAVQTLPRGVKRTSEALYNPTLFDAYTTIGPTDAWYTTKYLPKRPKLESTSHLPIYPQRPGEKDCTHYMKTRTCKFGDSCKFDHPIWVPEGGIRDWKEALVFPNVEYPERPGEPDCPCYIKTKRCIYGSRCKFNHPRSDAVLYHNSKGLPVRLGEVDCSFYIKTGSCKYGTTCRYNHPERTGWSHQLPLAAGINYSLVSSNAANYNFRLVTPTTSLYQTFAQPTLGELSATYPQRPGQLECDYYKKTGECKFGERCWFHHPADKQSNVKLSLEGYPRREGACNCSFYMKTGTCKYGATCKFDHPPPAEIMTKTTSDISAGGAADATQ